MNVVLDEKTQDNMNNNSICIHWGS